MLLQATNRMEEAEPMMRRALSIDEASYGEESSQRWRSDLNNLAMLLRDTNRLEEAEPMIRRALSIDEASYGEEHPNVAARDLHNLGLLLQATNRMEEAERMMQRALSIFVSFGRRVGHDHPWVKSVAENYRKLLHAMGQDEAVAAERVREVLES